MYLGYDIFYSIFCRPFWYQIVPSVSVILIRKGTSIIDSSWVNLFSQKLQMSAQKIYRIHTLWPIQTIHLNTEKWFSESCQMKPNLDCNYTFLIDLTPNGIPCSAESIATVWLQSELLVTQLINPQLAKLSSNYLRKLVEVYFAKLLSYEIVFSFKQTNSEVFSCVNLDCNYAFTVPCGRGVKYAHRFPACRMMAK